MSRKSLLFAVTFAVFALTVPAVAQQTRVVADCSSTGLSWAVDNLGRPLTINQSGILCTNAAGGGGGGAGTEYTEDAAAPANPTAGALQLRRKDTLSGSEVSADGDWVTWNGTSKGEARVSDSDVLAAINSSIPAGTNYIGNVRETDGTRNRVLDPCEAIAQTSAPISITTATTTRIVAPSASNKTYICSLFLTSAAADNVGIVEGTGGTCGTGTAGVIGGATATNGPNFAANGGVMLQAGGKTAVAYTAGTNVDLCLITSAATPLAGVIKYVQAP